MLHRWLLHELIQAIPQAHAELMKLNPDVEETVLMQEGLFHQDTATAFRTELHSLQSGLKRTQPGEGG